jgi:hypothetical protein
MKPKPIMTIALAVALCGGLLLAFPTLWMFLVLVLVGLVSAQVVLIVRNLHPVTRYAAPDPHPGGPLSVEPPRPDAPADVKGVSTALNRELFRRFQTHLEAAERPQGAPSPPAAPEAPGGAVSKGAAGKGVPPPTSGLPEAEAVQDRVALSAKAKVKSRSAYPPDPPARPPKPPEKEEDLFADLRPKPPPARKRAGAAPAGATPAAATQADGIQAAKAQAESTGAAPARTPIDSGDAPGPADDEAATLLKLAREALQRNDLRAANAGLEHHLSALAATPERLTWQARHLQARLAALEGDPAKALEAFEDLFKRGYDLKEDAVPALVDDLLADVKPDTADALRVSMLLKVLAVYRQAGDRPAMDRLYLQIEAAQERVGDERRLVQFLKNHLEVKKVMGESSGQLDLIDRIGNRLFRLGDTTAAREYYELGLKLRADLQQEAAAKTGSTPQPA